MKQIPILLFAVALLLLQGFAKSEETVVRDALLQFFSKLSNNKSISVPGSGWNASSDPCKDQWRGISCENSLVKRIDLDSFDLEGVFDPTTLCSVHSLSESLSIINLNENSVRGENLDEIKNCYKLTYFDIGSNRFANLPDSISELKNLQTLDVSYNKISGSLPDLSQMKGLNVFQGQENEFSGGIPELDFSNFTEFNVSNNFLSGPIPAGAIGLPISSFLSNPELCGDPLPNKCTIAAAESAAAPPLPSPLPPTKFQKKGLTNNQILMYIGYVLIGFVLVFLALIWLRRKSKTKRAGADRAAAGAEDDSTTKPSFSTVELKTGGRSKAEYYNYSTASAESGQMSSSLIVLTSPEANANAMRFEDLLKAPAELVGRGNHGSVYKVACEAQGMTLAVKRVKDWPISSGEFRQRMRRLSQVKHRSVMPAVAYYISGQEKLLVYDYQHNGSLFRHIHGNENGLDWSKRLSIANTIAEALAYMHEALQYDRVPHGNLKSSNILFDGNMEPCISEYGLMQVLGQEREPGILANGKLEAAQEDYKSIFKTDTYAFGVVLLELLTGRMALSEGLDLATWVVAVVREEWTVEVFDKRLVREGLNEERMVNVLQVAIRCVAKPVEVRPAMAEVARAIAGIREEDERSLDVSQLSITRSFVGL